MTENKRVPLEVIDALLEVLEDDPNNISDDHKKARIHHELTLLKKSAEFLYLPESEPHYWLSIQEMLIDHFWDIFSYDDQPDWIVKFIRTAKGEI